MVGGNGALTDTYYEKHGVRITGYGRIYRDREIDWSFRPYQTLEDRTKEPLRSALPQVAADYGTQDFFAPWPKFGTHCCTTNQLRIQIPFEHEGKRAKLWRGAAADIIILGPGQTFAISVGGCPIAWMLDTRKPDRLLVAHAGLGCLIDKEAVLRGSSSRLHRSVVNRMWESLNIRDADALHIIAGYAFPINPLMYKHEWDFEPTGDDNKRICEHLAANFGHECIVGWKREEERRMGRIDLGNLIRAQYLKFGIPLTNIKRIDAPDGVCPDGHPLWYVTRGPHGKDPRNLVIVTLYP